MKHQASSADWLPLLSEPAVVVTTDGEIVRGNDAFSSLVGAKTNSHARLDAFVVSDDHSLQRQLRKWARTKHPVPGAFCLRTASGDTHVAVEAGRLSPADAREGPVTVLIRCKSNTGAVTRFRTLGEKVDALTQEVLARQKAEQDAVTERERWRITLASVGDAVITTDCDQKITFMNEVAEHLTGWTLADATGQDSATVFNIVNEQSRQPVESPIVRVLREGVIVGLANHTVLIARDGREIPIDDSGAPIRDSHGEIVGTILVFRDISERHAADQTRARLAAIVESSEDAVIGMALDGIITEWNPAATEMFGYTTEEIVGQSVFSTLVPDDRESQEQQILSAIRDSRRIEPFETKRCHKDGHLLDISLSASPIKDTYGRVIGIATITRDITFQKQAERQLQTLNQQLEQRVEHRTSQLRELTQQLTRAEQRERRRIAQALHDNLQQMLVAARMRVETLVNHSTEPKVASVARHVQTLIDQSLDASRSLTLELSPPVLYDGGLNAALPWLARHMKEQYGLKLAVQVATDAEPIDEDVRVALFFAARELLFNIIKHSRTDHAHASLATAEGGQVRLVVQDEGVGFDPQGIRNLKDEATGFGLFSLRERIEFMGGRMTIESAPSQGTRIDIIVPQRQSIADAPPSIRAAERRKQAKGDPIPRANTSIRVLLVDDHQILREGIAGILMEYPDVEVVAEAADGEQAVELAAEYEPDVVIMDITLPKLNGIEATRLITQQLPHVRVLGLSMHNSQDMMEAMTAAGAVDLLVKDGPSDELIQAIRNAVAD
ncbi:PAS domain S-box protein [Phycisphaerales bacterium AB-hyl4]|uniref:Oxygen sensor histidine kinase NreB n=1 Tax=Natronomicrosphaera hydrolytica TaxID=3242702 RepID=A0ABV4U3G3_9BACT